MIYGGFTCFCCLTFAAKVDIFAPRWIGIRCKMEVGSW